MFCHCNADRNELQLVNHETNICTFSEKNARLITPTSDPSKGYFYCAFIEQMFNNVNEKYEDIEGTI